MSELEKIGRIIKRVLCQKHHMNFLAHLMHQGQNALVLANKNFRIIPFMRELFTLRLMELREEVWF